MTTLSAALARLLGWLAWVLPPGRRDWAAAALAEAPAVPAGRARAAWLAGGLRLAAAHAIASRQSACAAAFCAAAAGTAWIAWPGPAGDPVIPINRVDVIAVTVILAGMPRLIRGCLGPARPGWSAELIRVLGYTVVLALVLVKTVVERFAYAPPNTLGSPGAAWLGEIFFLVTMTLYAAGILAGTARRSPARPVTVRIGVLTGTAGGLIGYGLGPLGLLLRFAGRWPPVIYDACLAAGITFALLGPAAAGLAAARRELRQCDQDQYRRGEHDRQAVIAGLCAGMAAALAVSTLGTATIALLPHDAALLHWAYTHLGQAGRAAFGPGAARHYAMDNSVYAGGYLLVLMGVPLLAAGFGSFAAMIAYPRPDPPPRRPPGGGEEPPEPAPPSPPGTDRPLRDDLPDRPVPALR